MGRHAMVTRAGEPRGGVPRGGVPRGDAHAPTETASSLRSEDGMRLDIQALRAVAVLSVVIYHLWPNVLPGGFVGVDVFFVISGFLITSHLLKRVPRRPGDFGRFWARRIQRLIPPVVVVILVVLALMLAFVPSGLWRTTAAQSIASMFYVQNWYLIADATDYLNAHAAPSAFQHFWSLSVEEQYYIVWPLLIAALAAVGARFAPRHRTRLIVLGVALLVGASFVLGWRMTFTDPSRAYFATYARMWELGIGSLLAAAAPYLAALRTRHGSRVLLMCTGYVGIAASLWLIDSTTPFPGWIAALPTLSVAAVIAAEDPDFRGNPRVVLHSRPVQFAGDVSYALYLWHWPLLIIAGYALGQPLGFGALLAVLVLSLLAAWASTRFIETPVRRATVFRDRPKRVFAAGAAASVVVLLCALAVILHVDRTEAASQKAVSEQLSSAEECFGAGAADPAHNCSDDQPLVTSPEFAKADQDRGIKPECLAWPPFSVPKVCHGDVTEGGTKKVALWGDSHAGQWLPAVEEMANDRSWQLDTYIAAICLPTDAPLSFGNGVNGVSAQGLTEQCEDLEGQIIDTLTSGGYDLVIMSALDRGEIYNPDKYDSVISRLTAAGVQVVVIRDTPAPLDPNNNTADCVAANLDATENCDGPASKWIAPDPLAEAASGSGSSDVLLVGINELLCDEKTCHAVIGGVITFSDSNHLTATLVRTLRPYLEGAMAPMID